MLPVFCRHSERRRGIYFTVSPSISTHAIRCQEPPACPSSSASLQPASHADDPHLQTVSSGAPFQEPPAEPLADSPPDPPPQTPGMQKKHAAAAAHSHPPPSN